MTTVECWREINYRRMSRNSRRMSRKSLVFLKHISKSIKLSLTAVNVSPVCLVNVLISGNQLDD
jgi:hypothetical protein